ncbi:MAG: aminopeptidase N [Hyphomonadaceae bacterium]
MRTETPPEVRLEDYRPFPFRIEHARLVFQLEAGSTRVMSTLKVRRTGDAKAPLRLNGEKIELTRIAIDGRELAAREYVVDEECLTIEEPGDAFVLEIETLISPAANTQLSGLYMSAGRFCTQCEAEGFRRITYYPDRPDILAPFSVRIEAEKRGFPYLLSNGNPQDKGDLENGRHFAEWDDPFPKPSYLFALVGGDFDVLDDHYVTRSGRTVKLSIYVEKGDAERAAFAMQSLKLAMAWDEDVFGREYDLDVFQIVAVRDFNFGAMENKGLNIFNSAYVLADGKTATDMDFEAIESIVAHEYFHNWTGNRITCRDWFQLCLKEGLTVFRDQEFTQSVRSAAVGRIKEVIRLRARQFAEDAGPLAHSVRPDHYARIDNLYTATVYEKGAEIIRMLQLMLGETAFFAGMNRYFDQHDGDAATIEDFIACFEKSAGTSLSAFMEWYRQAGTPQVTARGVYDAEKKTYRLTLTQTTAPTPGQPEKKPLQFPMRVALFDRNGAALETRLGDASAHDHVLVLRNDSQTFVFENVASDPLCSLNRGFSAPVRLDDDLADIDRAHLAGIDDDPFVQWDSLQTLARAVILNGPAGAYTPGPESRLTAYLDALDASVRRAKDQDPSFAALLLLTPTVSDLVQGVRDANPDAIHASRLTFRQAIARRLEPLLVELAAGKDSETFDPGPEAVGERSLRAGAMSLLATLGGAHEALIASAFDDARTMTTKLAALGALSAIDTPSFDRALAAFEADWRASPLVMDKWYSVQAASVRSDIRDRLKALQARSDFDLRNPNRVRSLVAAFSASNPVNFHAADGWGYAFVADAILTVDPLNSALSARLASAFESWRAFDAPRREHAETALRRLAEANLSRNARDIVSRALEPPAS